MKCKLCGSHKIFRKYYGEIRDGGAQSNIFKNAEILKCKECDIEWLNETSENIDNFYKKEYYKKRFKKYNIDKILLKLSSEQIRWLYEIGITPFYKKIVGDYGSGVGIFLNLIHGFAKKTVAIEPNIEFNDYLNQKFETYTDVKDVPNSSIDVAVCFDTLEHIVAPKIFLKNIKRSLKPNGKLFIGVPNNNDYLKYINPNYLKFFYHSSHLFYFSEKSLKKLLRNEGFKIVNIKYIHKYNMSNMVNWCLKNTPTNNERLGVFDDISESMFNKNLERQKISSHILFETKS